MSHGFRLASLIAACVIPLATAAAADPYQRFQSELGERVEANINKLLEAELDAQTAELFARERSGPESLVEAKLSELVVAKLDAQTAELFALVPRPAAGDEIPAIADSAYMATRMTRAVGGSGTLDCVAAPVCGSDEVERPTVVASRPSPTTGC